MSFIVSSLTDCCWCLQSRDGTDGRVDGSGGCRYGLRSRDRGNGLPSCAGHRRLWPATSGEPVVPRVCVMPRETAFGAPGVGHAHVVCEGGIEHVPPVLSTNIQSSRSTVVNRAMVWSPWWRRCTVSLRGGQLAANRPAPEEENHGEQEVLRAFHETVLVRFATEVEVVHSVAPKQTVPTLRVANVLAETCVDVDAVDEVLAKPKHRFPCIPGPTVALTFSREFAQQRLDLVRKVDLPRDRLDLARR